MSDLFAASKLEPSDLERAVGALIEKHSGVANAVRLRDLMAATCLDERTVRGAVEQLVVAHRVRIGSCSRGYFMIATPEDLAAASAWYKRQALAMLKRYRILAEPHQWAELLGQLQTEVGDGR